MTGTAGSALVLANYTYQPIDELRIRVKLSHPVSRAVSLEGVPLTVTPEQDGISVQLPFIWTDIILLPR